MAVKFVPCTSIEQADEMYWAGMLHFSANTPWSPVDYVGCEAVCSPMKIISPYTSGTYLGGYMVED